MAYRRSGVKTWSFQGRTRHGAKQVSTGVRDRALARKLEQMWHNLAGQWAWDLLETTPLDELYLKYEEARHHLPSLRQLLSATPDDPDLTGLVDQWQSIYRSGHSEERTDRVTTDLRWLFPPKHPRRASTVTAGWLEERLAQYPAKPVTRRRVHSSWSVFFRWCAKNKVFAHSPMLEVEVPRLVLPPPKFYELDEVLAIVAAQPTITRKAFMAFMYGTGADLSPAVQVRRRDVDEAHKQVRIMGTKATGRDRMAMIQPWAWKYLRPHLRTVPPNEVLFPYTRFAPSDWHRETVASLLTEKTLSEAYPLRNCRHHLAVLLVRSGWPLQAVAAQLGNSVLMVHRHYARFQPTAAERAMWQRKTDEMIATRFPNPYTPASGDD